MMVTLVTLMLSIIVSKYKSFLLILFTMKQNKVKSFLFIRFLLKEYVKHWNV